MSSKSSGARSLGDATRGAVAIIGYSECTTNPDRSANLEDLIFRHTQGALETTGLHRDELDGIILAASDQTDGRAISSMLTAGPAGAYLNDEVNIASSPGHAFAMACLAIQSGVQRRVLLASWGKASENVTEGGHAAVERLSADPYFERDAGLSSVAAVAFQALAHRSQFRDAEAAVRAVVVKSSENAAANEHLPVREALVEDDLRNSPVIAHPLRLLETAPECDGVYALVLAAPELADPAVAVSVDGIGWCSASSRLNERDLVGLPHLATAARTAYRYAAIEDPRGELDFCEVHDYTADAEILAYEPLSLCGPGEAVTAALSDLHGLNGQLPVNPSGGSLAGEAPFGGGMRKIVDAVRQLRGEAGGVQVDGATRGLAQISTGYAGQFQTVVVLGRGRR